MDNNLLNKNDPNNQMNSANEKFCKFCGGKINFNAVVCPLCGCQVEEMAHSSAQPSAQPIPNIIINNDNHSTNTATASAGGRVYTTGRAKNKWISLALCIFTICGHKFYEGKLGMGLLYLFTGGLCGIGWIIDIIAILGKPNPYYV